MIKMAATPIYGKNPSPEPAEPRNLACSIGDSFHHCSNDDPGVTSDLALFYGKVKFGNLGFSITK